MGMENKLLFESLVRDLDKGLQPSPLIRAIISTFSIFRALSPKDHVPNFETVIGPFTGQSPTLDKVMIRKALKSLDAFTYFERKRLKSPTFFMSTKGGVNANIAYLSIGLDLIALMRNPTIYVSVFKYAFRLRYFHYISVLILMSIICLPLILFPIDLSLGRLGLIKELRGKCRIVGITNNWVQILLRPLHDCIYSFLDTKVPEDGTNNQLQPVRNLLDLKVYPEFQSVDLSAATDRLPVILQADILTELGLPGELWRKLLRYPYEFKGKQYLYEVGQPMGAYSSFAMLALTNHVIMHSALVDAGISLQRDENGNRIPMYAILGDDVAIASQKLAESYNKLMNIVLGVVINPIKGFDGKMIEFAKNWFYSTGVNLTPLGAKAMMQAIRNPLFITSVIADYNKKEYDSILKLELSVLSKWLRKLFDKNDLSQAK